MRHTTSRSRLSRSLSSYRAAVVWLTAWTLLLAAIAPPAVQSLHAGWLPGQATSVQKLAAQIDKLQRHIDSFGTIVAKDPDVWGQSRLMQHRQEFENEMRKELTGFQKGRLNAAEFTRDSAFLSSALSLQSALGRNGSVPPPVGTSATQQTVIANVPTGTELNAKDSTLVPRTDFSGTSFRTLKGQGDTAVAIGIEQTIELDQLKRYLDHLNEIRRLNEGDDTADSPGYRAAPRARAGLGPAG